MSVMLEDYFFVECEERIRRGQKTVQDYLAHVDEEKVERLVAEQVDLVGGRVIYDTIDRNLKTGAVQLSLLRELCLLYRWRRKFFDDNLPVLKGSWFTDSFCRDVIVFQVTNNFDQIVRVVCSNVRNEEPFPTGLFLSSDCDVTSRQARYRIDNLEVLYHSKGHQVWKKYFLTDLFLPGSYLLFSDLARVIVEHYARTPPRLEELAMTRVRRTGVALDQMTRPLLDNDRLGFLTPEDDVPEHLTEEGRDLFELLKTLFKKIRNKEDSDPSSPL